jgi:hypothetical protein
VMRGLPEDQTSIGAAMSDTSQEVAGSVGLAVTGTIVAAALGGTLIGVGATPGGIRTFENAVTTATLVLAALCAGLIGWAARRATRTPAATAAE